jgi:peroxin-10
MSLQGEILRAEQKDDTYIRWIRSSISSLLISSLGPQQYAKKDKWIAPLAKLIYYSATTLSDFQSLGEEYTGLVVVDRTFSAASTLRRIVFILSKSLGPNLLEYILIKLQGSEDIVGLERIRKLISLLNSLNTCLFFYQGLYRDVHRRLCGLQYAKVGQQMENNRTGFRMLGHLTAVQLILSAGMELYSMYSMYSVYRSSKSTNPTVQSEHFIKSGTELTDGAGSHRCPMCLDPLGSRGGSAATLCGHLGCWTCLLEVLACSGECPLCRTSCTRIIPLRN